MFILMAQILASTGSALALCWFCGWGAARLALPAVLKPYGALLAPLAGYALAAWAGYLGVSTALNLRWSLALLLAIAAALNVLAWRRSGPPRPLAALREHAPVLSIAALALLAGVLPLLQYGYPTTIGRGWDPESYLPMAQHLADYPLARIGEAPANPLRDLVRDPPRIGLTLGFSVLHGFTMLLSYQSALDTFAPLLALLRALGIVAVYVWLRSTMGLGRPAALIASALTAAGALLLWVAFFNFGMQIASWPLIWLGLAIGVAAIDALAASGWRAWPQALLAAVCLAALPVAYYPALTVFAPMAAGLGLARAIELLRAAGRQRASEPHGQAQAAPRAQPPATLVHLAAATLSLGLLTALLAAPTIPDYFEGFAFRYSLVAPKIGPDRFIPLTDILGLTPFRLMQSGEQPPAALIWAAATAALAMACGALLLSFRRRAVPPGEEALITHQPPLPLLRWILVLAPLAAYLAWLRFGRPYEYAYMKTSAYLGPPLWGALLLGWQHLGTRLTVSLRRPALAALAATPLAAALWAQALVLSEHGRAPALFGQDLAALEQPAMSIPAGATVLISADERFVGPNNGLFTSILYGRTIWGRVATAYFGHSLWPAGGTPQYALLAAGEPPWPLELGATETWRSRAAALFRFDAQRRILTGRTALYREESPADAFSPAAMMVWRRAGQLASARPGAPLEILVGDDLRLGPGAATGAARTQQVTLRLAALEPQNISLRSGSATQSFAIEPGLTTIELALATPLALSIESEAEVALIDMSASDAGSDVVAEAFVSQAGGLAWSAGASQSGEALIVDLHVAGQGGYAVRGELTIVEDTFESPRRLARLLAPIPPGASWRFAIDPSRQASEALLNGAATPLLQSDIQAGAPDGVYVGVVALYSGEEAIARAPLFTIRLAGGRIAELHPVALGIEHAWAGPPPAAPGHLRLLLGGTPLPIEGSQASVEQVVLAREPAWPGAPADAAFAPGARLGVRLHWHAGQAPAVPLMISAQVLGPDDRKWAQWDGPAGGEWRPAQSWQPGERVRQDVPLTLDPTILPGTYRVLLIAYDPASGTPRPIAGQQALLLAEITVR